MKKKNKKSIKLCAYCGSKKIYPLSGKYCKKHFKQLENWELVDIGKHHKLKPFNELSTQEFTQFCHDELVDQFGRLAELYLYLVRTGIIDEKNFRKFCKEMRE